jgi:hypothetical protein
MTNHSVIKQRSLFPNPTPLSTPTDECRKDRWAVILAGGDGMRLCSLRLGFTVAPILAGLDKFFNLLVNWDQYLPPFVNNMLGGHGHELMLAVGVIEIIAGLGVAFKPRVFAYVVSAWLILIVINLLMIPGYFDVALRDFGLALGAFALARLSQKFDQ